MESATMVNKENLGIVIPFADRPLQLIETLRTIEPGMDISVADGSDEQLSMGLLCGLFNIGLIHEFSFFGKRAFGDLVNCAVSLNERDYTCITIADTLFDKTFFSDLIDGIERERQNHNQFTKFVAGATRLDEDAKHMYLSCHSVPIFNCMIFPTASFWKVGGCNPFLDGWGFYELDICRRMIEAGEVPGDTIFMSTRCYRHMNHDEGSQDEQRQNTKVALESQFNKGTMTWTHGEEECRLDPKLSHWLYL